MITSNNSKPFVVNIPLTFFKNVFSNTPQTLRPLARTPNMAFVSAGM